MASADVVENLELLFDRPSEPLILPKGGNKALFILNDQLVTKEFQNAIELNNRFGSEVTKEIPLKKLRKLPSLPKATQLDKNADFSLFFDKHQEMAAEVIDALMAVPENQFDDLISTCAYTRINLNPQLFNYCYSVALAHRKDTKNVVRVQNHAELFPFKFMNSDVFGVARETANVIPKETTVKRPRIIIPRDYTATNLDPEHRLAYFREDIGVNLHHWHWHLVYPFNATDIRIVQKDRRGELFFYMHQQIIARYNSERLCNNLPRVIRMNKFREPIPEAYFPKLDSLTAARGYPPRQANMTLRDVNRPVDQLNRSVETLELWIRRIEDAIAKGRAQSSNGESIPLTIDILGNMMESSILSPNREFYGDIHNTGHILAAYIHDPEHRHLENFSVMADEAITMRDPYFYRWHAFIDDIFQQYKQSHSVRPYARAELENPGVTITGVHLKSQGSNQSNVLNTFWMTSDVDLSRGLDFTDRTPVYARFTHLNHQTFNYTINYNNSGDPKRTTVRIFIAPKFDERNQTWNLADQRKMFIEMDRFVTQLSSGNGRIMRSSLQSSVTIPFEQTFRDLSAHGANPKDPSLASFNFCGCGWPQHMLCPKGNEAGMTYQLFVMFSNYDMDNVNQPDKPQAPCDDASSFCGLQDQMYPDRRSMGYPFDRPSNTAENINDFILPNMALQDIMIRFENRTEENPKNPQD